MCDVLQRSIPSGPDMCWATAVLLDLAAPHHRRPRPFPARRSSTRRRASRRPTRILDRTQPRRRAEPCPQTRAAQVGCLHSPHARNCAAQGAPPCGDTGAVSAPPRGCTRTRCVGHSVCPQSRIVCPPHGTRVGLECLAERGRSTHADVGGVHTPTQLTCAGLPAASAPDPYINGFHYATFHVLVPGSFEMGCNFCGTQASWSSPLPLRSML